MLSSESMKLKHAVSVCDDNSPLFDKSGIITFIEEKKGFRRSLSYFDITLKFEGIENEITFREWNLYDPLEEREPDPEVVETPVNETEPTVTKRKKRQSAKRMSLTKDINSTNIINVPTNPTNQPKEIIMTSTASTSTVAPATTETAVKARLGRPTDPNSAIHTAVAIVKALPVADRKSQGKAAIEAQLGVKPGTAMVYYYNAIKTLTASGDHPVKAPKAAKAPKAPKAVKAVEAGDATVVVSPNAPASDSE